MSTPDRNNDSEATESSILTLKRWPDLLDPASLIALAWTLAQIAFVIWPSIDTLAQRALHVGFALALAVTMFGRDRSTMVRHAYALLGILAFVPALYIAWNAGYLTGERVQGLDGVTPVQFGLGLFFIVALFEAGRRSLGLGLTIFSALFVLYFFLGPYLPGALGHRYSGLERFVDTEFLSLQGVFGVPVGVSVSTVFYFIFFAAIYDVYGGGKMIIQLAFALTGRAVGGPAKAAVVSSGLLGSVSGSAVANVMSTGIFTIPLMKRVGYAPTFAGAVEAAASTGGQLVPPVMGAAAFIMADYLQVPYQTIVLAAILPAAVYYLALLLMVDLKARAENLGVTDSSEHSPIREVIASRGHLLIPLAWLVYRIVSGFPVENSALEASVITVIVGTLRAGTRRSLLTIVEALIVSAERTVVVALPCALAGVVVAIIAFTGLGTKFTGTMIWLSGGNLWLLLSFTMLASLILGTGMPTTSAYIMAAVLLAPALTAIGVTPITAHFFIFYFAILSMVTPPVALAAYAAASISRASASGTGWSAFRLSMPGFLIPFGIVMHPGMLLIGTLGDTIWGLVTVIFGFGCIAIALIGWFLRPIQMPWRLLFVALGILSILPDLWTTAAAFILFAAATAWLGLNRDKHRLGQTAS
ncbi:MAG: TRAP transporter fused permease subunit [Rhodopseudomonas sp.]|nr:TRAP transporter fused permease subunit [Rhodopseudomonas sp.]